MTTFYFLIIGVSFGLLTVSPVAAAAIFALSVAGINENKRSV